MKKKYTSSGITPILIILLIAIISISAYLLGTQKNIFQSPQRTPSPTQTPDQTIDWKTYNLYEITFKYPSTWKIVSETISNSGHYLEILSEDEAYLFSIRDVQNKNPETGRPYADIYEFLKLSTKPKTVNVGGEIAYVTLPRAGSETNFQVQIFASQSHPIYIIGLDTPRDGSKLDEGKKIFDQILSTIYFGKPTSKPISQIPESQYYTGSISPRVPYKGLKFVEIDVHNFKPISAKLEENDYHEGEFVYDGYTFTANQGEDFEFTALEDRNSNPGSFIDTELYGYGPTVIKMGTVIGWGVPVTGRYFYVVEGSDRYGPNFVIPDGSGRSYDGSKYGQYTLEVVQRK